MTIRTNQKPIVRHTITADKRIKPVWDTDSGKRWASPTDCADELEIDVRKVYACCGKRTKTCAGRHLRYEEDVEDVRVDMGASLTQKDAEIASLRAEVERLRQFESAQTKNKDEIAQLEKLRARHQRAYDRYIAHAKVSLKHIEEIDRKLEELKNGRK